MHIGSALQVAALSSVALLLAGCGSEEAAPAEGATSVTIAMTGASCLNYFPFYVAQDQGQFADNGLDVTIQGLDGSSSVIQAMSADRAEFGTPGPGPGLLARQRGEELIFTYNYMARQAFNLVGPQSQGIGSAADLKGATIGVATVDGTEVGLLETIMREAGVEDGQYTVIPVGDGGLASASLIRGEIKAYIGNPADIATIRATLDEEIAVLTPDSLLGQFANGLAARSDVMQDKPELVKAFGTALADATVWSKENPDAVLGICASKNPEESADSAYAREVLETVFELTEPLAGDGIGFFPEAGWTIWMDNLRAAGELTQPDFDVSAAYTNEFAEDYKRGSE